MHAEWFSVRWAMKTVAVAALFLSSTVGAAEFDKADLSFGPKPATCGCKGPGDCTCPKDKCKCKGCGKHAVEPVMFKSVKGSTDTTKLPDTASVDARGGVLI